VVPLELVEVTLVEEEGHLVVRGRMDLGSGGEVAQEEADLGKGWVLVQASQAESGEEASEFPKDHQEDEAVVMEGEDEADIEKLDDKIRNCYKSYFLM
jgi:hypothetical protein